MLNLLRSLLLAGLAFFRTRRQLAIENLALGHQLGVLKRSVTIGIAAKPCARTP